MSNEKGNTVTVLDAATLEVIHTIEGLQRPRGITASPDGKHIYVCASDDNLVRVFDSSTYVMGTALAAVRAGPGTVRPAPFGQSAVHRERG